jgi:hypothetical protein
MWTAKARSIVLLDGLNPAYFRSAAAAPEHPVLLPAIEAIDFRFMGLNTQVLHLQFWLLAAGFVGALVALLHDVVRPLVLWPVIAAIVFAPAFAYQAATAYADVPLAIFFALAGVCGWRWLALSEPTALGLLALFAAASSATKFEGLVFAGSLLLVLTAVVAASSRRRAAATAAVGVVALVGVVPWRIWMAANEVAPYHSIAGLDAATLWARLDRIPASVWALTREMLDPTSWLLLVPIGLASVALAVASGERRGSLLALGTVLFVIAGLTMIYWLTPLAFDVHLQTSADRVVAAPVLLLASLTPVLLDAAIERPAVRRGGA